VEDLRQVAAQATHRLSERSALFPTSTIMTSFPRSERTSSIHFVVDKKDWRSGEAIGKPSQLQTEGIQGHDELVISNTTIATEESRI